MTVQNNSITGSLPPEYAVLTTLTVFKVALNLMMGILPPQYAAWQLVSTLYLYGNMFTGPNPTSWSAEMTRLQILSAFNNMLRGTIPRMNFPLLTTFAISFNDFSGQLPPPTSWLNLTILDVQNNSNLSRPIILPAMTYLISSCGTQLCVSRPGIFLAQLCLPSGAIATAINTGRAAILPLVSTYSYQTVSCGATTTAPRIRL